MTEPTKAPVIATPTPEQARARGRRGAIALGPRWDGGGIYMAPTWEYQWVFRSNLAATLQFVFRSDETRTRPRNTQTKAGLRI